MPPVEGQMTRAAETKLVSARRMAASRIEKPRPFWNEKKNIFFRGSTGKPNWCKSFSGRSLWIMPGRTP